MCALDKELWNKIYTYLGGLFFFTKMIMNVFKICLLCLKNKKISNKIYFRMKS